MADDRRDLHDPSKPRATFFDQDMVDHLLATIARLTQELSVTRDRLDTLERVLAAHDLVPPDAVDSFQHDLPAQQARAAQRLALVDTVFRVLSDELAKAPPNRPS